MPLNEEQQQMAIDMIALGKSANERIRIFKECEANPDRYSPSWIIKREEAYLRAQEVGPILESLLPSPSGDVLQALREALKVYDEPGLTPIREDVRRMIAVVDAARDVVALPVGNPTEVWSFDMDAAPDETKLWFAINEIEGVESVTGFAWRDERPEVNGRFFQTYSGLNLAPYAWMPYEAPTPPAAPHKEEAP